MGGKYNTIIMERLPPVSFFFFLFFFFLFLGPIFFLIINLLISFFSPECCVSLPEYSRGSPGISCNVITKSNFTGLFPEFHPQEESTELFGPKFLRTNPKSFLCWSKVLSR